MKNFEKCGKEMLNQLLYEMYGQDCRNILKKVTGNSCADMDSCECCGRTIFDVLNEEYIESIHLTHDEYVILKNLPKNYKYITCIKQGLTCEVYDEMPVRVGSGFWKKTQGLEKELPFIGMFQFIKYEDEPYEIAKLIADYEKENGNES